MRYPIISISMISLVLTSCAFPVIREKMDSVVGQSIGQVIDMLGPPDGESNIAGRHIYVWKHRKFYDGSSLDCTIQISVGSKNEVTDWTGGGNQGACQYYADRLR